MLSLLDKGNLARSLKRKIICHVGPTNSGKTHNALEHLMKSKGVFCGPLRLLAFESYKKMLDQNCRVNLITGEERIENFSPAQVHQVCSTVEMVNTNRIVDVGIIDEIQMIGCTQRGHGWTRALLNLPAQYLYLCGEERALPVIKKLVKKYTDDEITVIQHERFGEIRFENQTTSLSKLKAGDCVVGFKRNDVFYFKRKLEERGHKVSVIYGDLPPESRVEQAELFNSGVHDIICATDCIGMGLNLEIQRVIFASNLRFNGVSVIPISDPMVRQIGGRAGRHSSKVKNGIIGAFHPEVLRFVEERYNSKPQDIEQAVISFTQEDLIELKAKYPLDNVRQLLNKFFSTKIDSDFIWQNHDGIDKISEMLSTLNSISARDLFSFLQAPVKLRFKTTLSEIFFKEILLKFNEGKFADPFKFLTSSSLVAQANLLSRSRINLWEKYVEANTHSIRSFHVLPLNLKTDFNSNNLWQLFLPSKKYYSIQSGQILEQIYTCLNLYLWLRNRFYFHPTFNYSSCKIPTQSDIEITSRFLEDGRKHISKMCSLSLKKPISISFQRAM
eukprot:NODE_507_length_6688_cov_1.276673.p1 type:complete len:558 gc:universal NODE_507_length_6688_cov_1.276673:2306-3979(+)